MSETFIVQDKWSGPHGALCHLHRPLPCASHFYDGTCGRVYAAENAHHLCRQDTLPNDRRGRKQALHLSEGYPMTDTLTDGFRARKQLRITMRKLTEGMKLRKCCSCNGSGHYDAKNSPPCGACNGTGKERYRAMTDTLKQFDPEKVERWDCKNGQFLDGKTSAIMQESAGGEYVYAWQFDKLLALWRENHPNGIAEDAGEAR